VSVFEQNRGNWLCGHSKSGGKIKMKTEKEIRERIEKKQLIEMKGVLEKNGKTRKQDC